MNESNTSENILAELRKHASAEEAAKIRRFFKGDLASTTIVGVRMRDTFATAKKYKNLEIEEVVRLLHDTAYEARMTAVSILDFKARNKKLSQDERRALFETYITNHDYINNWDLVDRAAPYVVGQYLIDKPRDVLLELADSDDPWRRRTAITATLYFCRFGTSDDLDDIFKIAAILRNDPIELVAKAVGIALKYSADLDEQKTYDFVAAHAPQMNRVTLRYATERYDKKIKNRIRRQM